MSRLLKMFRPKPKPKPKTAKELQDELRMLEKKKMDLQSEKICTPTSTQTTGTAAKTTTQN